MKVEEFSSIVKDVRLQLGLSQKDLAEQLGVSFATVNRWENGKVAPSQLAWNQFESFCAKSKRRGRLNSWENENGKS